jgi:HAD superfamily phosphoserine phosphatase-like hydrolase
MPRHLPWLAPFGPAFQQALSAALDEPGAGKLACFDADGTLWSEDIGEAFFRWLAAGALLPPLDPARDPFDVYAEYEARVHVSRAAGFAWAVQCMAGLVETDVRRWCRQMAVAWPNYRPAMIGLVAGLAEAGCEVWLVSASNVWIVEASAPLVGVDPARVLGLRVAVEDGRLTERVVPPVTCNAGKVEAIRARLGRTPDIAVGDSLGDLEMLESARVPLVVGRADKPGAELVRIAAERGWATHLF